MAWKHCENLHGKEHKDKMQILTKVIIFHGLNVDMVGD